MANECLLLLFVVFHFLILPSAADEMEDCPKFYCGRYGELHFPFTNTYRPECGLYVRGCDDPGTPQVEMGNGEWYNITGIYQKEEENSFSVIDPKLEHILQGQNCTALDEYNDPPLPRPPPPPPPYFPVLSFEDKSLTLLRCKDSYLEHERLTYLHCDNSYFYGSVPPEVKHQAKSCSSVRLPFGSKNPNLDDLNDIRGYLTDEIIIKVILPLDCHNCHYERGGQCRHTQDKFQCVAGYSDLASSATAKRRGSKALKLGLAIGCPVMLVLVILLFYKRRCITSKFRHQSKNIYADRSRNHEPESSTIFFGIPIFSYKELEEATNNFDSSRELGDGGFGTVYYGILRDGREVAVKRLYEHNYRRVEQFLNEIAILTRLRHRNLVSFYGCTSRNSRELLLVYEYIPNGTVGCHLHGDLAKPGMIPWPLRMKIAIEIASALAYLHASDIIHRDVKTNNILLDNSFCVKVADFGLSRLFPNNVTHISTAPQGTPGYVDPEYRQCYQLTNKSDVYSFGVVLIELISSLPAVDTDRQRDEINLANLAIKKIENFELSELVDPSLGFGTDIKVRRMIESVAKLALQCLQLLKEYRPSMDEVLEELKRIESGKEKDEPNCLEQSDVHVDGISIHVDGASNRYARSPKPRIHWTI